jgi:hypothetical protein
MRRLLTFLIAIAALSAGARANAEDPDLPWLDNAWYKLHLNVRARVSLADLEGLEPSQAYTLRTRAGLEAKPLHGFSALAELEHTWSLDDSQYFDAASTPNGKTPIADPENLELNRAWVQYASDEIFGAPVSVKAKGGKQRIIFDDARFIGNVGWRQNEQTYDGALGQSNWSIDGLTTQYAYVWHVQRVFGNQGPTADSRDYDSDAHLARVHYGGFEGHDLTAFAYLLDFGRDSIANSSNSYGVRAAGKIPCGDDWTLGYSASYAYQTDAGRNRDYEAHYGWAHLEAKLAEVGTLGVAYEHRGSDDGNAQFVTPLATAHKFNGFADAFLGTGGPRGLQDLAITVSPQLPWKLNGKVVYHEFWRADGGAHLAREVDAVLSRPLTGHLTALVKGAWFDGRSGGPADRYRVTFALTFAY